MIYVISDIHGCFQEFIQLLKKINFTKYDTLYILGDLIDRGQDSIKLLNYVSMQPNIYPLFGNHDYTAYTLLPKLIEEITEEDADALSDPYWLHILSLWLSDGGMETVNDFKKLDREDQEFLLEYMEEFGVVVKLNVGGKEFVLSHSLPDDFHERPVFAGRDPMDIINGRPDFHADWNFDTTYIIGHTPTRLIHPDHKFEVYRKGSLYDIDCGCVYGGKLAALCLDTEEIFYS